MITVTISINGSPIFTRSAVRVETGEPNTYKVDTGTTLTHYGGDGAVILAHKLLDTIIEPRHEHS